MISNQMLQKTIEELKDLSHLDMVIMDPDGRVAVKTFEGKDISAAKVADFAGSDEETKDVEGFKLFKIKENSENEYILAVKGTGQATGTVGRLARYQLETMLAAYKEKYDKDSFIRSLILDNLLLIDIYDRSKKLHIEAGGNRVVFLVRTENTDHNDVLGVIRNIFADQPNDFVLSTDRKCVIVVKSLEPDDGDDELEALAAKMNMALKGDLGKESCVAYGTIVSDLKDVSKSYKEAKLALDVGRIFFENKNINAYTKLGIGRLIFQLPMPLCKLFIREVFGEDAFKELDEEMLMTTNKFLECSLNVSETSRQLFIHRNTLVYRLDKIQKTMGLDLRQFEDAITFKIALMVSQYIDHIEGMDE